MKNPITSLLMAFFVLLNPVIGVAGQQTSKDIDVSGLRERAMRGDVIAQRSLAFLHRLGIQVEQDYELAFEWYKRGAEQGDAESQHGISAMYLNGFGVEKNLGLAFEWERKAAQQGGARYQQSAGSGLAFCPPLAARQQSAGSGLACCPRPAGHPITHRH